MTDRIAIITGGSRGLGSNTAINLERRGVDILFTWRANQQEAESLVGEAEAIGRKAAAFRLNTRDIGTFDAFVAEVGRSLESWGCDRFDYLVNNAGNSQHISFDKVTETDFDSVVNRGAKGYAGSCRRTAD